MERHKVEDYSCYFVPFAKTFKKGKLYIKYVVYFELIIQPFSQVKFIWNQLPYNYFFEA